MGDSGGNLTILNKDNDDFRKIVNSENEIQGTPINTVSWAPLKTINKKYEKGIFVSGDCSEMILIWKF